MTAGPDTGGRPGVTATVTVTVASSSSCATGSGASPPSAIPTSAGSAVVATADGRAEWTATDSYRLGRLTTGAGRRGRRRSGSPSAPSPWPGRWPTGATPSRVTFSVGGDTGRGVLRVDGVEVPFDAGLDDYPDVEEYLIRRGKTAGTAVTLAAEDLFAAIHGANLRPPWLDDDDRESFVLHVDATAGRLRAVATWDGHADTSAAVACAASGDARVGVNPSFLYELASAAGEDVLTLHLPPDPGVPLRVETDDGFLALLMPVRIGVESARPGVRGHAGPAPRRRPRRPRTGRRRRLPRPALATSTSSTSASSRATPTPGRPTPSTPSPS